MPEEENLWGGDEGDEMASIKQKLLDLESQIGALNPRNLAGIKAKELRAATRANLFGDGSDGNVIFDGTTDLTDFSSRSGTVYSLTRDLFANNLTINTGVTLKPAGFRIFASADLTNNGTIHSNGGDGGNGGNASGDTGGTAGTAGAAAHAQGSLPASLIGKAGKAGSNQGSAGTAGEDGTDSDKSLGAAGVGGGGGGSGTAGVGSDPGGAGGNGGSKTGTVYNAPRSPQAAYLLADTQPSDTFAVLLGSPSSGSGGSGGGGNGGGGGGGSGGSGAPGGFVVIFAYRIINNGIISANGGNGGNGGNGSDGGGSNGGGGGGGGGAGSGGVLIFVYGLKSGSGTETVDGGTGGTPGTANNGNDGSAGSAGNTGSLIEVVVG